MNNFWNNICFVFFIALINNYAVAGNLIAVGPGKQHVDLPSAIGAAQAGDVIQVDPMPQPYSAMNITGKGISVVSSIPGQRYLVAASTNQPAITVSGIGLGQSVTIYEAEIQYPNSTAPAIHVHTNAGGVRFKNVQINTLNSVTSGPRALVEVDHSMSVWFSQVNALTHQTGISASTSEGINGLLLENSGALVQSSAFSGFTNPNGTGGNAIQLDRSKLWITALSLGNTEITGGDGAIGGNGIFQPNGANSDVLGCARDPLFSIFLTGGTGQSNLQGGRGFWFPGGSGGSGGAQWAPSLPQCAAVLGTVFSTLVDRVSIGTQTVFTLEGDMISTTDVGYYGLALGTPRFNWNPWSPNGYLAWDPNFQNGQAGGGFGLPAGNVWPAFNKLIPNNPGLIGYQLSVQGWLTSNAGLTIGEPQMLVVMP